MRNIYFSILSTLLFSLSFAQTGTVNGSVKEEDGEPAIQANIIVDAATGLATVTDFDGNYSLTLPIGEHLVLYRYIGKEDKIKKVNITDGSSETINVVLIEKVELINTVVVSASKYEKKLSEETVSMEVLKSSLLEANNIVNVEDGMNKVPGVTIIEGQANIRGGAGWSYGAGSRVMILYDDLPLLSADAADTKWSFLPTENVEQIEVIKGAASSLYGSGALNGVINIRTGYAKSIPETKVSVWSGIFAGPRNKSDGWWYETNSQPSFGGFNFVHKRKINRFDLVIHGQYTTKHDDLQENDGGDARIGGKFRFRPRKIEGLSVGVNVNAYRSWGSVFFLWNGIDENSRVPMPGTASAYQNNRITVDPFITFYDKKNNQYSLKTRYLNTANRNNTGQGSIPVTFNWDLQYNRFFNKGKWNVVGGLAGFISTVRSPTGDPATSLTGEHNGSNIAPYIQVEKKLFDERLNLTVGSRYEYFKIHSLTYDTTRVSDLGRPLFRVGANYRIGKATFLRASYGEGFRFPTMAELFVNSSIGGIGLFPNPGLQSEQGWYAEVAVKQGFKVKEGFQGYIDAAFFVNRYDNMMEFNFGEFGVVDVVSLLGSDNISIRDLGIGFGSQNVGNTRIMGIELSGGTTGKIGKFPLNILAGYTYIEPISLNWDDPLVYQKEDGSDVIPGTSLVESVIGLSTIKDGAATYAGASSSSENVLKYRNKHTFQLDISSSVKKFDYGISIQYRSFMQNIDQFFVSDFLTEEISQAVLDGPFGALFETGDPSNPYYTRVEDLIGTEAFTGLKEFRERYNGRGTTLIDARIAYHFNDRAKLSLVGKNLLNLTYDIRPTLLGDPMNFAFQFNYKFKHDKKD